MDDVPAEKGSLFSQKYFEGYKKRVVLKDNGKVTSEFVYEGTYYTYKGTGNQWARKKLFYVLMSIAYSISTCLAMSFRTPMNNARWIAFFETVSIFSILGIMGCTFLRCMTKRKMTRWEYRMTYISLKEMLFVALVLSVALTTIFILYPFAGKTELSVSCVACFFISSLIALITGVSLRHEKYLQEESNDLVNGIDITNDYTDM